MVEFECIVKVVLMSFSRRLNVGYEKEELKMHPTLFHLSNWKKEFAIYCD